MNTTGLVTTITDELIEQLEALTCIDEGGAVLIHTDQVRCLLSELRRLRAENAELAKDAGRYRWLSHVGELTPDQFGAINEWLWCDGDFTYIAKAIDIAMATQ